MRRASSTLLACAVTIGVAGCSNGTSGGAANGGGGSGTTGAHNGSPPGSGGSPPGSRGSSGSGASSGSSGSSGSGGSSGSSSSPGSTGSPSGSSGSSLSGGSGSSSGSSGADDASAGGNDAGRSLALITSFAVLGDGPGGVVRCAFDGTCYFDFNGQIYRMPPNGTSATAKWVPKPTEASNDLANTFALDGQGNVFACYNGGFNGLSGLGHVMELASGAATWVAASTGLPTSITCAEDLTGDGDGTVYLTNNSEVWKLSPRQTTWVLAGSGLSSLRTPQSKTAVSNGDVYVGRSDDVTGNAIDRGLYLLKSGASSFTKLVSDLSNLFDLVVDSAGNVYGQFRVVTDADGGYVAGGILKLPSGASAWTRTSGFDQSQTYDSNIVIDGNGDAYVIGAGPNSVHVGGLNAIAPTLFKLAAGSSLWTEVVEITGTGPQNSCASLAADHLGHLVLMCGTTLLRSQP